jgi:hypothetical protein
MNNSELKYYKKKYHKIITKNIDLISTEIGNDAMIVAKNGINQLKEIQVPTIAKGIFSTALEFNIPLTAFHISLKEAGYPVEKSIRIFYRMSDRIFDNIPMRLRRTIGYMFTSKFVIKYLKKTCQKSTAAGLKDDFIISAKPMINKKGYVLETEECGIRKFYANNNVPELIPYCSFFDYVQAKATNLGIKHIRMMIYQFLSALWKLIIKAMLRCDPNSLTLLKI